MLTTIRSYTYETEVTNILKRYSDKKTDRQRERESERERKISCDLVTFSTFLTWSKLDV